MFIASHAVRRFGSFVALGGAVLLSSCRQQAPVARHFLRMPAEHAGGLSSIQRAQWLKQNRRNLPDKKTLTASGHLVLGEISTAHGAALRGVEVLYAPGSASTGGLAVITKPGDLANPRPQLHLLTCDHFVYAIAPSIEVSGSPAAWRINSGPKSITGYSGSGSPVTVVWWSGSGWRGRRLP